VSYSNDLNFGSGSAYMDYYPFNTSNGGYPMMMTPMKEVALVEGEDDDQDGDEEEDEEMDDYADSDENFSGGRNSQKQQSQQQQQHQIQQQQHKPSIYQMKKGGFKSNFYLSSYANNASSANPSGAGNVNANGYMNGSVRNTSSLNHAHQVIFLKT
jgi:hypothetical protein